MSAEKKGCVDPFLILCSFSIESLDQYLFNKSVIDEIEREKYTEIWKDTCAKLYCPRTIMFTFVVYKHVSRTEFTKTTSKIIILYKPKTRWLPKVCEYFCCVEEL